MSLIQEKTKELPAVLGAEPVRQTKLYYAHQYIDQADIDAVVQVLKSDFLTTGPAIASCERRLCEITGAKYAVLCANGTAALHMACMAAGIGEGDEVITTPITFAASANCALYCGARPVFADINDETYQIDPAEIERKITDRTRAFVAVDFGGQSVPEKELLEIRDRHGLVFIEDGAHVIGTSYHGQMNGSFADMTTLSFHPVKTIAGGEGGAVLTDNPEYYQKLLLARSHGITRDPALMEHEPDGPWYYEQIALSTNYRITEMQAALIESQLNKLKTFGDRKKEIVRRYDEAFSKLPGLRIQKETEGSDTVRHLYILRIDPAHLSIDRRQFFEAMGAENIVCNVHYIPIYYFPYYEKLGYRKGLCPKAEKLYEEMFTIPLYYAMTDQDVEDVIRAVTRIAGYYEK